MCLFVMLYPFVNKWKFSGKTYKSEIIRHVPCLYQCFFLLFISNSSFPLIDCQLILVIGNLGITSSPTNSIVLQCHVIKGVGKLVRFPGDLKRIIYLVAPDNNTKWQQKTKISGNRLHEVYNFWHERGELFILIDYSVIPEKMSKCFICSYQSNTHFFCISFLW